MGRLVYSAIASLDGFVCDDDGGFDWAAPDEDVHRFINEGERGIGTYLYGRRMYEVMRFWETAPADAPGAGGEYGRIWREADKIVYSTTLGPTPTTARTRIEPDFDPDAVRRLIRDADHDLGIGGATLAGQALAAGLVEEVQLYVAPVIVGGGTHWLPRGVRVDLTLLDSHRFGGGVVHLRYRVGPPPA